MKRLPIATIINALTVILGSILGLMLEDVYSDAMKRIIFQAIGLGTIIIALKMILKIPDGYTLLAVLSLILGGVIGTWIGLDTWFLSLSEHLKNALNIQSEHFSEGLITAFLLFCVGSMTIVGAIEEGLNQNRELLMIKATLDGFASIALASSFGIGVLFSALPLLLFQGSITLLSQQLRPVFDENTLDFVSAIGGLLILGIAINMLQLGEINLENLLPSLFFAILASKAYLTFKKD